MKYFLNIGKLLSILLFGFVVSMLVSTSAFADTQDSRFRISALTGDIPVVEDLKSLDKIGDYLTLTIRSGLLAPDYFHIDKYIELPSGFTGTLTNKEEMLNIAYTKPVAC